ncbi:MAG: SDR family NAD(P)-dependent oxidoreductase, partial [Acidimicrobiaceae bacterium]|nr:SDR family NAD(P)-dependent oxidoreductase [Acidimicrobiaceae bacterium]
GPLGRLAACPGRRLVPAACPHVSQPGVGHADHQPIADHLLPLANDVPVADLLPLANHLPVVAHRVLAYQLARSERGLLVSNGRRFPQPVDLVRRFRLPDGVTRLLQLPYDDALVGVPPRLDGRVAFVAGASRGIGRDIALALARAGAAVAVAARTEEPGKLPGTIHSVSETIAADGGVSFPVVCDVTSEASVEEAVAATRDKLGTIDILVANAAAIWLGTTLETPLKRWDLSLRVNLTGTFLVTRAVLPGMIDHARGSLIAITTTGARQIELGSNAYWVSKAGIERYYAGLATELRPYNIAVNCLGPNKVVMTEGAIAGGTHVPADMIEPGSAISAAAVYLAAQTASTLTGTVQYSLDLLERIGEDPG